MSPGTILGAQRPIASVAALVAAPDASTWLGLRDRAVLRSAVIAGMLAQCSWTFVAAELFDPEGNLLAEANGLMVSLLPGQP